MKFIIPIANRYDVEIVFHIFDSILTFKAEEKKLLRVSQTIS